MVWSLSSFWACGISLVENTHKWCNNQSNEGVFHWRSYEVQSFYCIKEGIESYCQIGNPHHSTEHIIQNICKNTTIKVATNADGGNYPWLIYLLPIKIYIEQYLLIHKTIQWAKKSKQPMIFLKLNFSKAYDKVNWDFMLKCIERIGIPSMFMIEIRILSSSAKACVNVNIKLFQDFDIDHECLVGVPMVPCLFFILGEFFNATIKKDQ